MIEAQGIAKETGTARNHYDPVLFPKSTDQCFREMPGMTVSNQDNGLGGIRITENAQAILHILSTARLVRIILSCRGKCESVRLVAGDTHHQEKKSRQQAVTGNPACREALPIPERNFDKPPTATPVPTKVIYLPVVQR